MRTIVLSGGTGFFGKFLATDLLKYKSKIILLVRANSQQKATNRVKEILKTDASFSHQVTVLNGDLTQENLGLGYNDYLKLISDTTHILHAAASTRFTLPLNEARRNNVETTKRLLFFAKDCKNLERFGFISTAFVAGKRSGVILEEEFEHTAGFLNTYEESKYEAEMIVRSMISLLPIVIFRPSLIITPYIKSGISPVNALTLGLFLARKGFLPILPGSENSCLDIIEGTVASKAIVQIFFKSTLSYLAYHITSAKSSPQIKDFISLIEKHNRKRLPIRFCGNMEDFTSELKKVTHLRPDLSVIYKKTQSFLPELSYPKIFDNSNLLRELNLKTFSLDSFSNISTLLK